MIFWYKNFLKTLQKFFSKTSFRKIVFRAKLLIELKINAYAIALQFRNGKLEKSIKREGRDVPNKIIKVQNIPKQLALSGLFQVRGEIYIPNRTSNFSKRITSGFFWAKERIR